MGFKDSNIIYIGEIPSNWQVVKFKRIAKSGMGETILKERLEEVGFPVYSATEGDHIFGYLASPSTILNRGDLIIPARGNSIGHVKLVTNPCTSTQTTIYSKIKGINSKFLYYQAIGLKEWWFEYDNTAIPQITVNQVQNNPLLLPSDIVQNEVVKKLDYHVDKINQLIINQKQQIEKLKEYKQSLISEVVTKGLNPNVEFKDSGIEWIRKIPKDAQLVQLKRLAIINNGKEIVNVDGEIPVYGSGGIFKYTDDYLFQGESILYGRKGTIDKPLHVNGKFWTVDTMFYTEISELVIPRYLYYVSIGSINFDYYKSGSVLPSMTQFELGNVLLPFFDKKSQEKIIEYLDYKTSLLDKVIEQKSSKIKKLEEFKKSLIYEYVTGKRIV